MERYNKRRYITIESKDNKSILWTTYANKFSNLDEMGKLLERHNYQSSLKKNG